MTQATTPREIVFADQISDALLEKYNRPGPRYTSYPTAPVWKDDFGPDDLEKSFAVADRTRTPLSLYMHLSLPRRRARGRGSGESRRRTGRSRPRAGSRRSMRGLLLASCARRR